MHAYKRIAVLMCLDALLAGWSAFIAYYLMYGSFWNMGYQQQSVTFGLLMIVFSIACLKGFKLYNRVWEYASIGEIYSLVKALSLAAVAAYAITYLLVDRNISAGIMIWTFETVLLGIGGIRFVWRMLRGRVVGTSKREEDEEHVRKVMIVGAGSCGALIAKEMLKPSSKHLKPICFIDDDRAKLNCGVYDITVVGSRHDIAVMVERYQIDDIFIAIPSASAEVMVSIMEICKKTSARVRQVPQLNQVILGKQSLSDMLHVEVEDLLGRDPIHVDLEHIATYVSHKTILITGAGGSIGSELCRQIAVHKPAQLLLLGHGENSIYLIAGELRQRYPELPIETIISDIKDLTRLEQLFQKYRPEVVFHAAAHKHVPLMESNPGEAIKNNVYGTHNVAYCAHSYGVERFVLISTDKAVNPTSVMGATKRIAELIVQSYSQESSTVFTAVRFGNVLGSRGSVIPHFRKQITSGGPVTVTHPEMTRYFMTIPEAVQLVIQAGALAKGGEVFILDMGEPVKIVDLARRLISLSGYEPNVDISIVFTGMRPGEKLYEELLTDEEGLTKTNHERILIGRPSVMSRLKLDSELAKLEKVLNVSDHAIRDGLRQLVPTYLSNELQEQHASQPEEGYEAKQLTMV